MCCLQENAALTQTGYYKIPKISPGAYIFSNALFEGLIYRGEFPFQNQLG